MTEIIEIVLLAGLLVTALVGLSIYRRRRADRGVETDSHPRDNLDTVAAWPPEVTRLLTGGERTAHETLVKALPECMIFSQVPLSRFLRVTRRHSYAEWLTRVGHLCVDFLICDRASLVIGAVTLQSLQESEGAARRRVRMTRVMKAAGVKVFVWREEAIPTAQVARDQIMQRTGVPDPTAPPEEATGARSERAPSFGSGKIPIPEVVTEMHDDSQRLEPPASTWFDDLDGGPTPADPGRKRPQA